MISKGRDTNDCISICLRSFTRDILLSDYSFMLFAGTRREAFYRVFFL